MANALVVDYAWSHPAAADINRVGYSGVMRYLSSDLTKNLSAVERDQLLAQGLSIGLMWETGADRALSSTAGGQVDGAEAGRQANALGFPGRLPIYYAVDFPATPTQLPLIERYLLSASSASGRPVGVYGSFDVVEACGRDGAAVYFWQTAAWSSGRVSTRAHLYQRIAPTLPRVPGSYDEDVVLQWSYGQWGGTTPPAPQHDVPGPHQPPLTYQDEETGEIMHRMEFDCGSLDGQGNAQIIWGDGTTHESGVADFSPAITYDKFRNCWVRGGFAPADGHPPSPGRPAWSAQQRDGFVTIELTGGTPGLPISLELTWAD